MYTHNSLLCQHKKSVSITIMSVLKEREKEFAFRLKCEREKQKISQLDLAFKAELSQNIVNLIETGKRVPNLSTIFKLCDALEIAPVVLFTPVDFERETIKAEIERLIQKL